MNERPVSLEILNLDLISRYSALAEKEGINLMPNEEEIGRLAYDTKSFAENPTKKSIPHRLGRDYSLSGAFFAKFISPYIPTSKDAFRPTDDDIKGFCDMLSQEQGATIVLYYAFAKAPSPGRTGSPNWRVDAAEFEMLKNYVNIISVAKYLGLNLNIVIVDETPILLGRHILGINEESLSFNQRVFELFSQKTEGKLIYRSLSESVKNPLGDSFESLYQQAYLRAKNGIENAIGNLTLTPGIIGDIIRMGVFVDMLPLKILEQYGLNSNQTYEIYDSLKNGRVDILFNLPNELFLNLIDLTAHVRSMMELRFVAGEAVQEKGLTGYPEYDSKRIYGGVTRSQSRWSFLPLPVRYKGRTVNPMHGLAVYDSFFNFRGVCPKRDLPAGSNIFYLDDKPVFVKINT